MSRTILTDRERAIVESVRRKAHPYNTSEDLKVCYRLQTRGLLKIVERSTVATERGSLTIITFKATKAGIRVLNGEAAKPTTDKDREDRAWKAETNALRQSGKLCDILGCSKVGTHGHHKKYKSGGGREKPVRVVVCDEHHDWLHDNKKRAIELGYSVSSHSHIAVAEQLAPSQRRTA